MKRIFNPLLFLACLFCNFSSLAQEAKEVEPVEVVVEEKDMILFIANLCDPKNLTELKEGEIEGHSYKILYWLYKAQERGHRGELDNFIALALITNGTEYQLKQLVHPQLAENYRKAGNLGLFTADNLELLRHGKSAIITKGAHVGEAAYFDHIVSAKDYPQFRNDLFNLQLLSESEKLSDRSKLDYKADALLRKLFSIPVAAFPQYSKTKSLPKLQTTSLTAELGKDLNLSQFGISDTIAFLGTSMDSISYKMVKGYARSVTGEPVPQYTPELMIPKEKGLRGNLVLVTSSGTTRVFVTGELSPPNTCKLLIEHK